jgi:hypothetical protein
MAKSKPIRVKLPSGEMTEVTVTVNRETATETGRPGAVAGLSFGIIIKIERARPEWSLPDQWWRGDNS